MITSVPEQWVFEKGESYAKSCFMVVGIITGLDTVPLFTVLR